MSIATSTKAGLLLVLLASGLTDLAKAAGHGNEPDVVVRYCSGCHGLDGNSELPYIPSLAGLGVAYQQGKLAKFRETSSAAVDEPFARILHSGPVKSKTVTSAATVHMVGVANGVSAQDLKPATEWYAAQDRKPGKPAKNDVVEQGKNVYTAGLQSQGVPACQTCHGAEGQGTDKAPRLAGQHAPYMLGQLTHFRMDDRSQSPMREVARALSRDRARAVTNYLQSR